MLFGKKKKSILFVCPDYHCSYFYRDELRKLGWKADIYLPPHYPERMIYAKPDFEVPQGIKKLGLGWERVYIVMLFLFIFWRYKYHFYYGDHDYFSFGERCHKYIERRIDDSFRLHLWISKLFKRTIIHLPSGFPYEEMPDVVEQYGDLEENVQTQDPARMKVWFETCRRYVDLFIGYGLNDSSQCKATHIKYKAIDLQLWSPDMVIPEKFRLPPSDKIRVMHSFMFGEDRKRLYNGNIKGTKYLEAAMERLISEGYPLEYFYFDNIPSNEFRYYQAQADIIVEELIRGMYGSTAVECMALGKPVITFVRPQWEAFYYGCFPDAKPLPLIISDKYSIYDVLKKVVSNPAYRNAKGAESRRWAEANLDPRKNAKALADMLLEKF